MATTIDFIKDVLPSGGEYHLLTGKTSNKPRATSRPSLSSLSQFITDNPNNTVYFGTASYTVGTNRKAYNVEYKRSFYIDIDCGETKFYATQKEAYAALVTFLKVTGFLVPSYVVSSGYGLHVYWCLNEDIKADSWLSTAEAFKAYLESMKLVADPAVTADVTRIMRAPGSKNWKEEGSPKACKIVKEFGTSYSLFEFRSKVPLKKRDGLVVPPDNVRGMFEGASPEDMLSNGRQVPHYFSEVVKECPTLNSELETQGGAADYNRWFLALKLLAFCEDGQEYVHRISRGHPQYNEAVVQRKFDQLLAEKDAGQLHGATTCEGFSPHSEECKSCPKWDAPDRGTVWRSPIYFGKKTEESANGLPSPYVLTTKGLGKWIEGDDGSKEVILVCSLVTLKIEIIDGDDGTDEGGYIICLWINYKKALHKVSFNTVCLTEKGFGKLAAIMARRGFLLSTAEVHALGWALVDWYKHIRASQTAAPALESYGWVEQEGERGFAVGEQIYWEDGGSKTTTPPDPLVANFYKPKGTEQRWREMVGWALEAKHIETEVIMASAFASPLVKFTGVSGCMLSAVSPESGTGKTLAMRLAQSVWGDPMRTAHSMNDTVNSVVKKIGISNNLPNYWDELRINGKEGAQFVDFLFQMSQGRDKQRMHSTAELRKTNSWCTMLVFASNHNLQEHVAAVDKHSDAGRYRVLEFYVQPLDDKKMHSPMAFGDVPDNYGHIGPKYASWLAQNHDKVQKDIDTVSAAIVKKFKSAANERFFIASLTSLIVGAKYAKELGYVGFNVPKIKDFLYDLYDKQREALIEDATGVDSETSALGIIAQFMTDQHRRLLITDTDALTRKTQILRQPPDKVVTIRQEEGDNRRIMMQISALRRWVTEYGASVGHVTEDVIKLGGKRGKQRITSGLNSAAAASVGVQRVLEIPYNDETKELFSIDLPTVPDPAGAPGSP